jgi:hypothetical protein
MHKMTDSLWKTGFCEFFIWLLTATLHDSSQTLLNFSVADYRTEYWYMTNYELHDYHMKDSAKCSVFAEYKEGIILPVRRLLITFVSNGIYDCVVQFCALISCVGVTYEHQDQREVCKYSNCICIAEV